MAIEQWEDAAECLEKSILLDPNATFSWYNYGICQFFLENYSISLRAIKQAFSIDPLLEHIIEDWVEILDVEIEEYETHYDVDVAAG